MAAEDVTPYELEGANRAKRNMEIVAARIRGLSWHTIANTYGLSERQCKQILADYRAHNPSLRKSDPLDILDSVLEGLQGAVEELAMISATTSSDRTRVAAIQAKVAIHDQIVKTLQTVGVLPNDLGVLRLEVDARVMAERVIGVIEKYDMPAEVTDAMIAALGPGSN